MIGLESSDVSEDLLSGEPESTLSQSMGKVSRKVWRLKAGLSDINITRLPDLHANFWERSF